MFWRNVIGRGAPVLFVGAIWGSPKFANTSIQWINDKIVTEKGLNHRVAFYKKFYNNMCNKKHYSQNGSQSLLFPFSKASSIRRIGAWIIDASLCSMIVFFLLKSINVPKSVRLFTASVIWFGKDIWFARLNGMQSPGRFIFNQRAIPLISPFKDNNYNYNNESNNSVDNNHNNDNDSINIGINDNIFNRIAFDETLYTLKLNSIIAIIISMADVSSHTIVRPFYDKKGNVDANKIWDITEKMRIQQNRMIRFGVYGIVGILALQTLALLTGYGYTGYQLFNKRHKQLWFDKLTNVQIVDLPK